jgi:hypothetical protein
MSYGLHLPDFVKVWINGTERTSYVISYERTSSLCQRADTFTISFTKELPRPDPYDEVEIQELYEGSSAYVIRGYFISINEDYANSTFECIGQDKSLLLDDYFIYYKIDATGQTVDYWISHIASLVGLSVKFDSYTNATVGETDAPTPMGMQTAGSALDQLERAGAYYIKYDGDIDKLRVFRYKVERPAISLSNDKTLNISETKSTEKTRNVVKVFGGWKYNIFTGKASVAKGFAKVNLPEMLVDKTTVIANPLIKRDSVCRLVASRILAITGVVDDVYLIDTHGFYPNVKVGKYAYINVSASNMSFDGDAQITSITAKIDNSGAITSFKIGDKCPRVSIVPLPDVVFAAGTGAGALISLDAGDTFEPFFEGLSGPAMNSWSIASNKYNQLMLLTQDGVYKRPSIDIGASWSKITNLDSVALRNYESQAEIKASGLSLTKVEKESGKYNTFHIMGYHSYPVIPTGYGDRWWVLYTKNFGTTWDSMPLYTPNWSGVSTLPGSLYTPVGVTTSTFLETAGSGITYSVIGYDLEGDLTQNITALVGGGALDIIPPSAQALGTIHYGGWNKVTFPSNQYTYIGGILNTINNTGAANQYYTGGLISIKMLDTVSVPNDRDVAYHLGKSSLGTTHLFRTKGTASSGVFQHCLQWTLGTSMEGSECLAVDYSSLNGDSKVRLAIPGVYVYNLTATKCLEESGSYALVRVTFIDDDIGQLPGSGISTTQANVFIGSTARGYGGLYGWTSHPTTTTAAWRGINNASSPPPSRNLTTAVTENKTDDNTGTAAVLILGKGLYSGGEYSADEPELGNVHLRDIDETKNVGLFVIKYDFSTKTITSVNCYNWFLNYVPTYAQPSRATAVRSNLIVVELPDESSYWVVSDEGNIVGYFNKSDIEGSTLYGIRDIPFYSGDAFLYTTDRTDEEHPSNNRCIGSDLGISDIFAPPPVSGLVQFKSHPDYGNFAQWKMYNLGRMYKAERASPTSWYWAGYGLPGQSPNFSWQSWDFRTASGGEWMG